MIAINFVEDKNFKDIFDDGFKVDTIIKNISLKNPDLEFIPNETVIFFLMKCRHVSIVQPA